ncbi:MAG: tRNA uracil 4-sulfurtransferase ThiI [Coriobacteriales bacterium]
MARPVFLVHYHEIGLKGRNRSTFEHQFIRNIEFACEGLPVDKVSKISGRILVSLSPGIFAGDATDDGFVPGGLKDARVQQVFTLLKGIPGVARVSLGWRCGREFDEMLALSAEVLGDCEPFQTFKVNSRRSNTDYEMHSMEMNQRIGAYLCERFPDKTVRMREPDAEVHVEVIQGSIYIYARTEPGVGGLPVGSAGKFIALLSTGIDSPVAMWRLIHRGAVAVGLHFSGAPETDDSSEYLVRDICDALAGCGGIQKLYIARIGEYQRRIAAVVPSKMRVIFFRRLMFTVANELARRENCKALVTGESLGQVASQTMENIMAVDAVATIPVFRPLIGTDKLEIIGQARELGTYELSTQQCADCCTLFLPRSPETHADLEEVEALAAEMDFASWALEICDSMECFPGHCNSRR